MQVLYLSDSRQPSHECILNVLEKGFSATTVSSPAEVESILDQQFHRRLYTFSVLVAQEALLGFAVGTRRFVQKFSRIPLMVLTRYRETHPISIAYLDSGAAIFLASSPFEPEELTATVRTLARRSYGVANNSLVTGNLRLCIKERKVFINDIPFDCTSNEYKILEELVLRGTRPLSRQELLHVIYGDRDYPTSNCEEALVSKLRTKLRLADAQWRLFGHYPLGYRFADPDDQVEH